MRSTAPDTTVDATVSTTSVTDSPPPPPSQEGSIERILPIVFLYSHVPNCPKAPTVLSQTQDPAPDKAPIVLSQTQDPAPAKAPTVLSHIQDPASTKAPTVLSHIQDPAPAKTPIVLSQTQDAAPVKTPIVLSHIHFPALANRPIVLSHIHFPAPAKRPMVLFHIHFPAPAKAPNVLFHNHFPAPEKAPIVLFHKKSPSLDSFLKTNIIGFLIDLNTLDTMPNPLLIGLKKSDLTELNRLPIELNILPIKLNIFPMILYGRERMSIINPNPDFIFLTNESPIPSPKKFNIFLNGQSIISTIPNTTDFIISGIDEKILPIPDIIYPNTLYIIAGMPNMMLTIVLNIEETNLKIVLTIE